MTRQIYETEQDRKRELEIAQAVAAKHGYVLTRQPKLAAIDYMLHNEERGYGWMEVRCRNIDWGEYPTIIVSAKKFAVGMERVRHGDWFVFLVQTLDKTMLFNATKKNLRYLTNDWGGRSESTKRDELDQEWVVHIPISLFTEIEL